MTKISNQYSLTNILTADLANSRLGINNVSPAYGIDLLTANGARFKGSSTYNTLLIDNSTANGGGGIYFMQNGSVGGGIGSSGWYGGDTSNDLFLLSDTSKNIRFSTNGNNERMRITAAGNVGIGTSTPRTSASGTHPTLDIKGGIYFGSTAVESCTINNDDSMVFNIDADNNGTTNFFRFATNTKLESGGTELLKLTEGGEAQIKTRIKVGIGDNPTNHVIITENQIYSSSNAALFIQADSTGKTMINASGGNILLGTQTDNGEKLYGSGSIRATGTITANSDISLKKNLLKIENALEKVEKINGYTYELKEDDSKRYAGVIAQEIQTVLPEIVNKGNDGILGVEYGNISALLIEAIKELSAENTSLINRIEALENK